MTEQETPEQETPEQEAPEMISTEDMERIFSGGPMLGKSAVLVVLKGRLYKREDNVWRRLDNRAYRTVKEMTDADGS